MTKVVYNSCYGGFGLSEKAVRLARERSGNEKWGDITLVGETYPDGSGVCEAFLGSSYPLYNVSRSDPVLVAIVEELGVEANGRFANLKIRDLPAGARYRIDEYDGNERVMTVGDYDDWYTA